MTKYKKNDFVELSPTDLCGNGNAVAKDSEGFVFFLRDGVPGDVVRAKIIKVTKNYAVAIIDSFIKKSEMRTEKGCSCFPRCGGCVFQNISYEAECDYKRRTIDDDIRRIGGLDISVSEFYPSKKTENYRNKAVYPVGETSDGNTVFGFYGRNSHRICEHEYCLIGNPLFSAICRFVVDFCDKNNICAYNEEQSCGLLRQIYIRSAKDESFILTLVLNGTKLSDTETELEFVSTFLEAFPTCVSIVINVNTQNTNSVLGSKWRTLYGDGYLRDVLLGKRFRIAPASFYQVNRDQAELLYSKAAELADIVEGETILDLYCGTGTIGICLARKGCKLYGVEITPQAVTDARYNAAENDVDAEFICLDAGEALNSDRIRDLCPDVIILDPPRKGCGEEAVERISSFNAKRIVYISCDPATLARDLKRFTELGYLTEKIVGVDMFPRTGHVETIALLTK